MDFNPDKVGNKIRNIRIELGFNQSTFAKKIDATVSAVSNWENGRNIPSPDRLKAIADLGGISVNELLYGVVSEESFERFSLNSNPINDWDFNYGLQEFQAIGGSREDLYEEILEEYKKRSKYDKGIVNPEKHAEKWIKVFMASFGMAPPPTQVIIARYYTVPKKDRKSIDILLETLSGFEIKEAEKMLEDSKGLLTFIEEDL